MPNKKKKKKRWCDGGREGVLLVTPLHKDMSIHCHQFLERVILHVLFKLRLGPQSSLEEVRSALINVLGRHLRAKLKEEEEISFCKHS